MQIVYNVRKLTPFVQFIPFGEIVNGEFTKGYCLKTDKAEADKMTTNHGPQIEQNQTTVLNRNRG